MDDFIDRPERKRVVIRVEESSDDDSEHSEVTEESKETSEISESSESSDNEYKSMENITSSPRIIIKNTIAKDMLPTKTVPIEVKQPLLETLQSPKESDPLIGTKIIIFCLAFLFIKWSMQSIDVYHTTLKSEVPPIVIETLLYVYLFLNICNLNKTNYFSVVLSIVSALIWCYVFFSIKNPIISEHISMITIIVSFISLVMSKNWISGLSFAISILFLVYTKWCGICYKTAYSIAEA